MLNSTDCQLVFWSPQAAKTLRPLFLLCILGTISHLLFWIQFIFYPSVRQASMQWLYAYLTADLFLIIRFFFIYIYRWWPICLPQLPRIIICYAEAVLDNYLNLLQSYILLALNICRYMQIAHNHNVYSSNRRIIFLAHILIYCLPMLVHVLFIVCGWSMLENPVGDACDLLPVSLTIRLVFLLFSYFIPVTLALVFLGLCLRSIHDTHGIRTQKILNARLRYHRQLVIQSCAFYSQWLILWSPHLVAFPFLYKNSGIGTIAQMMNYASVTVDPIVIAALDVRFLQAWRSTGAHLKSYFRRQQFLPVPVIQTVHDPDRTTTKSSGAK